jgi:rhodanese-related sulfurtransferase
MSNIDKLEIRKDSYMTHILVKKMATTLVVALAIATTWQVSAKDISQTELQQVMKNDHKVVVLDVRTVEEFEEGHIPSAVNIPHKELEARLAELSGAKNTQVVIYCRSGRRAEVARQVLEKSGFNQLDHLSGDFNEWSSNDLPIIKVK